MGRLVAVLLSVWFVMTAWSQVITEREIPSFVRSQRSADFPSRIAKPVKGVQQHSLRPRTIPLDWKAGSRAVQLRSASVETQPKQFLDPSAPQSATGNEPNSVAMADFDGDGKADLAVANRGDNSLSVLLGNGDGTFQTHVDYALGGGPSSVAYGDFNGDGRPDLVVAINDSVAPSHLSVLLGNGDGRVGRWRESGFE